MARKVNQAGEQIIKSFEGKELKAYKCPAGIWTIGYGDTENVKQGMIITEAEADARLSNRLNKDFCPAVERLVKVKINDNQFSALVSLVYNIGVGAFEKSTLLRKLNAGDFAGAAEQFDRWNKAGGKVLNGLVKRRAAERKLFEA